MCQGIGDAGRTRPLAETIKQIADDAVAADEFATAQKLLVLFKSTALKSKDMQLIARATHADKEFADLRKQTELAKAAAEVLKQKPDDPDANLTVGKFECFWKNDWDAGLPRLAKSGNANLQGAAKKDLANPDDATEQVHVGDGWWKIAEAEAEPPQNRIKQRAASWYHRALPSLSGLPKAKIESRLDELKPSTPATRLPTLKVKWMLVFRSADPSIWNTDSDGNERRAVSLAKLPDGIKYLKMQIDPNQIVIIPMTKGKIGTVSKSETFGWEGRNLLVWGGHQLGIFGLHTKIGAPGYKGGPCIWYEGGGFSLATVLAIRQMPRKGTLG